MDIGSFRIREFVKRDGTKYLLVQTKSTTGRMKTIAVWDQDGNSITRGQLLSADEDEIAELEPS